MAPPKVTEVSVGNNKVATFKSHIGNNKMVTRQSGRTAAATMLKKMSLKDLNKRKADALSPPKGKTTKRSAFGDLTNAATLTIPTNAGGAIIQKKPVFVTKKATAKITTTAQPQLPTITKIVKPSLKSGTLVSGNEENIDPQTKIKPAFTQKKTNKETEGKQKIEVTSKKEVKTRDSFERLKEKKVEAKEKDKPREALAEVKTKDAVKEALAAGRKSLAEEDNSSLYASALESISAVDESIPIITPVPAEKGKTVDADDTEESFAILTPIKKNKLKSRTSEPPSGVFDFDKENWDDPCQVSNYAMDVFRYLKSREVDFVVVDYMPKQSTINIWMRSLLVDWMVDVQEHFELNHETLYLAVKIMDMYLSKNAPAKEQLQLVGASSLFIAGKYDERMPPSIDEFLHICENIYTRQDLIKMEIELFKEVDFCLGMPLSYRFLRRFARCCKTSMPVLTLARYILELSLMDYTLITESESKKAAAVLYLALRMKDVSDWTPTLEYYSGYKLKDFLDLAILLNAMLHRKPKEQLKTIRSKYSHTIFFEVAHTPLIDSALLK